MTSGDSDLKEVYITDSGEDEDIQADIQIRIADLRDNIDTESFENYFYKLLDIEIAVGGNLDLYELFSTSILRRPGGLIENLLLYDELQQSLDDVEVGRLRTNVGDPQYFSFIADYADANRIDFVSDNREGLSSGSISVTPRQSFEEVAHILLIIVNQIIFSVYSLVRGGPTINETIFYPYPGREDSLKPVLEWYEGEYTVLIPSLPHTKFQSNGCYYRGLDEYCPHSFISHASFGLLWKELKLISSIGFGYLKGQKLSTGLDNTLREELDRTMTNSIRYACNEAYHKPGNLQSICYWAMADHLFSQYNISKIVVGGNSSRERAILEAAKERDVTRFVVPHGITRRYKYLRDSETTMFVPGELGKQYLSNRWSADRIPDLVPLGRPYLQNQYREFKEEINNEERTSLEATQIFEVLVATQDFDDGTRQEFIETIIDSLDQCNFDVKLTIKIHPSESISFYEQYIDEGAVDFDISIEDTELEQNILDSDLVLTVNSNAGLEAILLGTPCISANFWEPFIPTFPYILVGPIPVLKSKEQVEEFFRDLSFETVASLRKSQGKFVKSQFELENDASSAIANHIYKK